jgi:hypothetical protein
MSYFLPTNHQDRLLIDLNQRLAQLPLALIQGGGTIMATNLNLLWVGGGSNQASNPNGWIDTSTNMPPDRPPISGDSLTVQPTTANPGPFTMNVSDNDLAGNTVAESGAELTANLSNNATMAARLGFSGGTFNLAQHSTLDLFLGTSGATVNMVGNDTAYIDADSHGDASINMSGSNTATINSADFRNALMVNLDPGARWSGTFVDNAQVNGGANSAWNNNGSSRVYLGATIGFDVVGSGSFTVTAGPWQWCRNRSQEVRRTEPINLECWNRSDRPTE